MALLPHLEARPPNILFVQTTRTPVTALAQHSMACDVRLHGLPELLLLAPLTQSTPPDRWRVYDMARWMGWPSWQGWGCSHPRCPHSGGAAA